MFLANITGIGGGTLRDLVLGAPVFWVVEPTYLLAGTLAAIFVYFTAHMVESRYRVLLWLDAIGMAAYTVLGAAKGLALGFRAIRRYRDRYFHCHAWRHTARYGGWRTFRADAP